ncbi:hypothetical protein QZH41_019404 [Actinostola sp. cb2023]|nr:hypothetical protein QZH41_017976 [Actinostola sp. cb2023]KAK3733490.1 hypothetical protein QZH41_019404 [Actinostola sp. cb2023]
MAEGGGRARVNREFRDRLTERVHTNLIEAGKLAQQLTKSSRSHEVNIRKYFWDCQPEYKTFCQPRNFTYQYYRESSTHAAIYRAYEITVSLTSSYYKGFDIL